MIRFLLLLVVGALVFCAVLLAPAPQMAAVAQVTSGPVCTRNSECTSPLVCMAGRCRSECFENRDCGAGRHCVVTTTPYVVGRCALDTASGYTPPEAPYCTGARDCTRGGCSAQSVCTAN